MSEMPTPAGEATGADATQGAVPSAAAPPSAPPKAASVPLGWVVLLALIALGVVGWQWYDARTQVAALKDEFPWAHVVRNDENLGWSGGNNAGIRYALERGATHVVLLNKVQVYMTQPTAHKSLLLKE